MATLNEVSIQLNVQGERDATAALQRFDSAQNKLSTSVLDSARKIQSINSRWKEAESLQKQNVISSKALRSAQTQLAREYAVLNGMTETYVRGGKEYTRVATQQAKTTLLNKQASEQAALAAQQQAQRMEQLRMRLDPVYRASQQYKEALRELIQFQRAGGLTMDQYRERVQQLKNEFDKVSQGGRGARRSMNNFNIGIQQAGYQVSDFAIQVQGGTNAFVAFSQQASQLVGILPLMADSIGLTVGKAIALSAGLGILIPLVTVAGNVLFEMSKSAKDAEEKASDLETQIESLDSALKKWVQTQEAAAQGMSVDMFLGTNSLKEAEEDLKSATEALELLQKQVNSVTDMRGPGSNLESGLADQREAALERIEAAQERVDLLQQRAAEKQKSVFEEQKTDLQQQNALLAIQLQFGEDSLAAKRLEAQQQAENYRRTLEQKNLDDDRIKTLMDIFRANQRITQELDASEGNANALAVGMDRVSQAAQNAASSVMAITGALRQAVSSIQAMEAGNAAAQRVISRGGSEIGARSAAAGAKVEQQMREAGAGEREIAAASAQATANERRRLQAQAAATDMFKVFDTGGGGGGGGAGSARGTAGDYLSKLEQEAATRSRLIQLSDEQQTRAERRIEITNKLKDLEGDYSEDRVEAIIRTEAAIRKEIEIMEKREAAVDQMKSNIQNAFTSIADGSASVRDAFRSLMRNIIMDVHERLVAEPAGRVIGNFLSSAVPALFSANGNAFNGQGVKMFANGGVVDRATAFGYSGGMGVMGEAGPEAIMPLKRGANGKLGVEGGGGTTVVQHFHVSANGDDSVKRIVRGEMPRMAEAAKAAVVDAKRRGGSYGRAF